MEIFAVGDFIRIQSDVKTVRRLQAGHGEWSDGMKTVRLASLTQGRSRERGRAV